MSPQTSKFAWSNRIHSVGQVPVRLSLRALFTTKHTDCQPNSGQSISSQWESSATEVSGCLVVSSWRNNSPKFDFGLKAHHGCCPTWNRLSSHSQHLFWLSLWMVFSDLCTFIVVLKLIPILQYAGSVHDISDTIRYFRKTQTHSCRFHTKFITCILHQIMRRTDYYNISGVYILSTKLINY